MISFHIFNRSFFYTNTVKSNENLKINFYKKDISNILSKFSQIEITVLNFDKTKLKSYKITGLILKYTKNFILMKLKNNITFK